jgi:hypothetical protein
MTLTRNFTASKRISNILLLPAYVHSDVLFAIIAVTDFWPNHVHLTFILLQIRVIRVH